MQPDAQPDPMLDMLVECVAETSTLDMLARDLARHHEVPYRDAIQALNSFSPNLAPLLRSAEGQTLLGNVAAGVVGSLAPTLFQPSIH